MRYELPKGWVVSPLKDVFVNPKSAIVDGPFGSDLKASEYVDKGIPIIRLQNIDRNRFIDKNIRFIRKEKATQLDRHNFQNGDIVMTKLGDPLGEACIVPDNFPKGIVVADVVRIRPDSNYIFTPCLTYCINAEPVANQLKEQTKGTTRSRVNLAHIRDLLIPLPPLPEQKRIVTKIEELFSDLDAGVDTLKKLQAQLKRYRQAVLKSAFEGKLTKEWREKQKGILEPASVLLERIKEERKSKLGKKYKELPPVDTTDLPELPKGWEWAAIEQVGVVSGGLTKNPDRQDITEQLPYLRVANVYSGRLVLDEVKTIGVTPDEQARTLLQTGDLLVVEGNGSIEQIGRVALWDGSISPCVHQNHIIKVRLPSECHGQLFLFWLLSRTGREMIEKEASSTSGLHTLSISKVAKLACPVPSISEQHRIVQEIESRFSIADKVEEIIESSLKQSQRLRQSILKKAFEGKLVPQNPKDEPAEILLERIKAEKEKQNLPKKRKPKE